MTLKSYRGYTARIRYSSEDRAFVGRLIGTKDIVGFRADNANEIEKAFHATVDDYIASTIATEE